MVLDEALEAILSERELAEWLDISRPTLQRQRSRGSGPPFVQLSERRIGYRKSEVERWLRTRTANRVGASEAERTVANQQGSTAHPLSAIELGVAASAQAPKR